MGNYFLIPPSASFGRSVHEVVSVGEHFPDEVSKLHVAAPRSNSSSMCCVRLRSFPVVDFSDLNPSPR